MSRMTFAPDGQTVYLGTTHNNYLPDPYCYLYAIQTDDGVAHAGDIDGDGDVDLIDLTQLLASFGLCNGDLGFNAAADLDTNGCIDLSDLATLLTNYGA